LISGALSCGFIFLESDNQTSKVWVPHNSDARDNADEVKDYYGDEISRYLIYVTSDSEDNDLMNTAPFEALTQFDQAFKELETSGITFDEICERQSTAHPCQFYEYALGFWEEEDHSINYDAVTPYQVHYRIQSGRGTKPLYADYDPHSIPTGTMFSGSLPKEVVQDTSGSNNVSPSQLYYFEAIQYEYTAQSEDANDSDLEDWEDDLEDLIDDFNDANDVITVNMYSLSRLEKSVWDSLVVSR
jgi:hypothetical protein